jgi:hypothetical protein
MTIKTKKMKSNYYTPEIEEFHVGFEYEYTEKKRIVTGEGFQINYSGEAHEDSLIFSGITEGLIRVKHLDQEDIESFGFKQESITSFVNKDNWYIEWMPGDTLDIYLVSDCRFKGIIKNKSELKRLLKQIGI